MPKNFREFIIGPGQQVWWVVLDLKPEARKKDEKAGKEVRKLTDEQTKWLAWHLLPCFYLLTDHVGP